MTPESIDRVIVTTCEEYGITYEELLDDSHKWNRSFPRKVICHILTMEGLTVKKVGEVLNRHYSTVIHHRKESKGYLKYNEEYFNKFKKIYKKLDL